MSFVCLLAFAKGVMVIFITFSLLIDLAAWFKLVNYNFK